MGKFLRTYDEKYHVHMVNKSWKTHATMFSQYLQNISNLTLSDILKEYNTKIIKRPKLAIFFAKKYGPGEAQKIFTITPSRRDNKNTPIYTGWGEGLRIKVSA